MFERHDHPFLHWIHPQLLDGYDVAEALVEFPDAGDPRWHTFTGAHEAGKAQLDHGVGSATRALLRAYTSEWWCGWLADFTGFDRLHASLVGGGLHRTGPGGRLDLHVDFNTHPSMPGWRRALNLLVYLDTLTEGDGGELVLGRHEKVIRPTAGMAVLFPTTDTSWHGHPTPLAAGRVRRSLAVYYFTPGDVDRPHSTEWLLGA